MSSVGQLIGASYASWGSYQVLSGCRGGADHCSLDGMGKLSGALWMPWGELIGALWVS